MTPDVATRVIERVTAALPNAEDRPGQRAMVTAVAEAIAARRHLVIQAPTGVGKSLGYLVPAVLSGATVVVTTATKALQDQLAQKDLPFLAEHIGQEMEFAVLKGRSNYLCLQRLREVQSTDSGQLELEELAPTTKVEIKRLATWAGSSKTGDMAELDWAPTDRAWQSVSVSSEECPGAQRCPMGGSCFAEAARNRAAAADIIVVNTHLYGLNVASGGVLLPEHDVVIIDEAHQLEDIMSDTVGLSISGGRFSRAAAAVRRIVEDPALVGAIADAGVLVRDALSPRLGERLPRPLPPTVVEALTDGRRRLDDALGALRRIDTNAEDAKQRVLRAATLTGRLVEHIDTALSYGERSVAFVAGTPDVPRLEIAPLDVGPILNTGIWTKRTAILTSATIPLSLPERVGLPEGSVDSLSVESPFDYEHHGLIYCAMHLPDPRSAGYGPATHAELDALDQRRRGPHARAVHELAGDGGGGRGASTEAAVQGAHPTRSAQAGVDRGVHGGRIGVSVRHGGLLPGGGHPGADALARDDRPHPVPPPG